jgi:hypothetical protein
MTPLPPYQAIPVRPKPTSVILSPFSQAKTDFFHSKFFQSGQNRPPPFQAILGSQYFNKSSRLSLIDLSQLVTKLFSFCYIRKSWISPDSFFKRARGMKEEEAKNEGLLRPGSNFVTPGNKIYFTSFLYASFLDASFLNAFFCFCYISWFLSGLMENDNNDAFVYASFCAPLQLN